MQEVPEAWDLSIAGLRMFKKILGQRQELVSCCRALEGDDLRIVKSPQYQKVGLKVYDGLQRSERLDGQQDWTTSTIQSMDLQQAWLLIRSNLQLSRRNAAVLRAVAKPKSGGIVGVHSLDAMVAVLLGIDVHDGLDSLDAPQRLCGSTVNYGAPLIHSCLCSFGRPSFCGEGCLIAEADEWCCFSSHMALGLSIGSLALWAFIGAVSLPASQTCLRG